MGVIMGVISASSGTTRNTCGRHGECVISASSARRQRVVSASSARHQRIISASSARHQLTCECRCAGRRGRASAPGAMASRRAGRTWAAAWVAPPRGSAPRLWGGGGRRGEHLHAADRAGSSTGIGSSPGSGSSSSPNAESTMPARRKGGGAECGGGAMRAAGGEGGAMSVASGSLRCYPWQSTSINRNPW
jgi:hypothetical protein